MKFKTGALYTQKLAHPYGRATSPLRLLCHQPDSQRHMLSTFIKNMVTERHDSASRLIIKTLSKDELEETSFSQIVEETATRTSEWPPK